MIFNIKQFFKKIKLTYDWYNNVLKNDYDFDYVYLLYIMKYKLERMKPEIENGYSQDAKITADNIQYSIDLLDKIIKDTFEEDAIIQSLDKHNINVNIFYDNLIENIGKTTWNYNFTKEEYKEAKNNAQKLKEDVIHEFFRHFENNFQKWWD